MSDLQRAVVVVRLEHRLTVGAEQRQRRVARHGAGGDHRGEHAVTRLCRKAVVVDVGSRAQRPDPLAGRDRIGGLRCLVRLGLAAGRSWKRRRFLGGGGARGEQEGEQREGDGAEHGAEPTRPR